MSACRSSGKLERQLIAVIHPRAGIDANIEGLVDCHEECNRVRDRFPGVLFAIHRERPGAATVTGSLPTRAVSQPWAGLLSRQLRAFDVIGHEGVEFFHGDSSAHATGLALACLGRAGVVAVPPALAGA